MVKLSKSDVLLIYIFSDLVLRTGDSNLLPHVHSHLGVEYSCIITIFVVIIDKGRGRGIRNENDLRKSCVILRISPPDAHLMQGFILVYEPISSYQISASS